MGSKGSKSSVTIKTRMKNQETEKKETTMIAYCGLNCGECDIYLATQADDDTMRAESARVWSENFGWPLVPEDINCDGCLQADGRLFKFCRHCHVRSCCPDKELATCADCGDYICQELEAMIKIAPHIGARLEEIRRSR